MERPEPYGIIAAPNASKVKGELLSRQPGPEGQGEMWEVKVTEAEDVDQLRNFAKNRIGETIRMFVPPGIKHKLSEGDQLEARLTFEGDEHGGAFFLSEGKVRKL